MRTNDMRAPPGWRSNIPRHPEQVMEEPVFNRPTLFAPGPVRVTPSDLVTVTALRVQHSQVLRGGARW